ncbi:MAG: hypothetical protein QOK37_2781 [Thermoanaerobaculia bacterium]|jgi:hypothetical protein|nr:hypothetical protein [Thermoanaerobaculia bacterium]
MTFAVETNPRAIEVSVTTDELVVRLADGRTVTVPLASLPRLLHATPDQRADFRLIGDSEYLNWPALEEDVSVSGLLRGTRAVMS